MLLNTLLVSGLASLAIAVPHLHPRFGHGAAEPRGADLAVRGDAHASRGLRRRSAQDITITQLQEPILSSSQLSSEVELNQLIQEQITLLSQSMGNQDNIRKNHFASLYNNVSTAIVIVTQVIDQRSATNVNTRYLARQIFSGVSSKEQVTVVIQESQQIVIQEITSTSSSISNITITTPPAGNASAQSSATAVITTTTETTTTSISIVTVDPNSMSAISNSTLLYPAGIPAPTFGGMQIIQDPAIIIEENQQVFVGFVSQQQQAASIIIINSGAAGVTIEETTVFSS